jgi:hypothetical protein
VLGLNNPIVISLRMSQPIAPTLVMLPSDLERQQIFYWLQKISSVTAWRRILEYYRGWATATEYSVREADKLGWSGKTSLPQTDYALILKGLAHCEEGVDRLSNGDKYVFKFDAYGVFAMARRVLFHWAEMTTRIEDGENGIDGVHTPYWTEFCETLTSACRAWQECAQQILEPHYLDDPGLTLYGDWLKAELKIQPFPTRLEPVPDPADNTFVRTNESTPFSGIWEPIDVPKSSLLSLITRTPKPQPPFKIVGAMNYLHGGSRAPRITVETATDNIDLDTTWRLLWRDDRYQDGTVPGQEALYHFTKPPNTELQRPTTTETGQLIVVESGATARLAGKWLVESDLNASIMLQKGEKLPLIRAATYGGS